MEGQQHACITGCALTYNSYRRGSRTFNKVTNISSVTGS